MTYLCRVQHFRFSPPGGVATWVSVGPKIHAESSSNGSSRSQKSSMPRDEASVGSWLAFPVPRCVCVCGVLCWCQCRCGSSASAVLVSVLLPLLALVLALALPRAGRFPVRLVVLECWRVRDSSRDIMDGKVFTLDPFLLQLRRYAVRSWYHSFLFPLGMEVLWFVC